MYSIHMYTKGSFQESHYIQSLHNLRFKSASIDSYLVDSEIRNGEIPKLLNELPFPQIKKKHLR